MKKTISNFIMYIILILVSITMLVPFVWMFLTAFKTVSDELHNNNLTSDDFHLSVASRDLPSKLINI